ncbi:sirohydrochlorin chelatase [Rhodobacter calidifons]|uniref:Cobalamin biosynthesis protein CbiX n=1 Tax=Rhodobacter calidifons TaxID=2715277 RepID=A0ABX0G206_9RHOB|nr:CbiX/SirB N-terminal domain-containing protein [Rhodobacter calidifons]NHB75280.1 cobalamin biosynthesis protein CbiX [Rhodobacter calidifons]
MTQCALILAHGQPSDPRPAGAALEELAARVERLMPGWSVGAATLAEEGAIARTVEGRAGGVVFPMFMAGGWFVRVQIPQRLRAAGAEGWTVLEPFGCDPAVHELCVTLVREAGADQVILAAHGSFKSSAPADIAFHVAGRIAAGTGAVVAAGFIDQEPRLSGLTGLTGRGGVCLPFFAAEGGHVSEDIPAALAEAGFTGRILPPVGLDARVPKLIAAAIARGVPVCSGACRWMR